MPIYEYQCKKCGVVETMQSINAAPLKNCPNCGEDGAEKIISRNSFQLQGNGWYKDGYSSSKPADVAPVKPKGGCGSGCGCH